MTKETPAAETETLQPADAVLTYRGVARWRSGHPWIFRSDVERVEEDHSRQAVARVIDSKRRVLGYSLLSRESNITLRALTGVQSQPTRAWFHERLLAAIAHRDSYLPGRTTRRLVFAEADLLPGLIVDQFGPHLVVQFLAWGMDALTPMWVDLLREVLQPQSILARNDGAVRRLEGLERDVRVLLGESPPSVLYQEGPLILEADLSQGQKTGAFLDQIENHALAAKLAGGKILDCFSYTGAFGLACAANGEQVTCVDVSADAVKRIEANIERNKLGNVEAVEANAFDYLRAKDKEGEQYDMIILDPPAFAKNKQEVKGAVRGYKEINLRAMKLLKPGGTLMTCSCSYHVNDTMFDAILAEAGADAHRRFRLTASPDQPPDHPVRLGFPESRYLKVRVLKVLE